MNLIADFNEKLKVLINKAKNYEKNKNYRKSIKSFIEVSEFCLQFLSRNPKLDVAYKNMLLKKIRTTISHIKSLKLKIQQIEQISLDLEAEKISTLLNDLPVPPADEPETLDSSVDVGGIEEEIITSDQKVKSPHEFKNIPNGVKEIKTKEYDFKTIITKSKSRSSTKYSEINSKEKQKDDLNKLNSQKDVTIKKKTQSCPFCGGVIEIEEKICSHCGTPLSNI